MPDKNQPAGEKTVPLPEEINPLKKEIMEGKDEQSRALAAARFSLECYQIENLTDKELLLLSVYVRKVSKEILKFKPEFLAVGKEAISWRFGEIGKEAAQRWFYHITGYHISDFKRGETTAFLPKDADYIKLLREKYNRGDN